MHHLRWPVEVTAGTMTSTMAICKNSASDRWWCLVKFQKIQFLLFTMSEKYMCYFFSQISGQFASFASGRFTVHGIFRGKSVNRYTSFSQTHTTSEAVVRRQCDAAERNKFGNRNWLVVEPTPLKHISQISSFPQVGVNINKCLKPPPKNCLWRVNLYLPKPPCECSMTLEWDVKSFVFFRFRAKDNLEKWWKKRLHKQTGASSIRLMNFLGDTVKIEPRGLGKSGVSSPQDMWKRIH